MIAAATAGRDNGGSVPPSFPAIPAKTAAWRTAFVLVAALAAGTSGVTACASIVGLGNLAVDDCFNGCDGGRDGSASDDGATAVDDGPGGSDGQAPADGGPMGVDAPAGPDATADASAPDGSGPDAAPKDASPPTDGPCPGTAGPTPLRVGTFCIDTTEVTNAHYAAFLASKGGDTSGQPTQCQFNTSLAPSQGWPVTSSKNNYPVVYVDWCDAYAYCAWAGKRLCGAIGGGSSSRGSAADKNVSQWYAACSDDGARLFPYGNTYVQGDCNDSELHAGSLKNVGSMSTCQGGYSGLFDMNGNAYEWEDSCDVSAGPSDACLIRGGAFDFSGASYGSCPSYFNDYSVLRSNTFNDTGFRCCSP